MAKTVVDVFSQVLLDVYRASAEQALESFQDRVLDAIKPLVAFDSCMWGTGTFGPPGLDVHTIHLHNKSPEMLADYAPHSQHDTVAARVVGKPLATVGSSRLASNTGKDGAGLREVLRKHEQENVFITASTDATTGLAQWLSLFRRDPEQYCQAEEIAWINRVSPHLMAALAQNRSRHAEILGGHVPRGGALIADARGLIYHATAGCDALLRAEASHFRAGMLPEQLRQAAAHGERHFAGASLVAEIGRQKDLLFICLRPRAARDDLSPHEQDVAGLMASGLSHKEAAKALGRAPATVRNQLQSVYRKLHVQNIAAMAEALR